MAKSQIEIMEQAQHLAANLVGGPTKVGKNVLLSLLADFLTDPKPDREKLRRTLDLVQRGEGGHLKRGGGYGDQVRLAAAEIHRVLGDDLTDAEYKSLFGWAARLLLVKQSPTRQMERRTLTSQPTGWRGKKGNEPPPPPPLPPPKITSTRWNDVEIGWHQGSPAVIRGKQTVTCPRDLLPSDLLDALKSKKTKVKADVLVVKIPGGGGHRIDKIESWKIVP